MIGLHSVVLRCSLPLAALLCAPLVAAEWKLSDMVGKDRQGRPVYRPMPMDPKFKNPISEEDERAFQERARQVIAAQGKLRVAAGNTFFENEKRTYGYLMAQVLSGREGAIKDLQLEDVQAKQWHRETKGIDFYACFTIKHQTRKFFYFGDLLEPAYRQRMLEGARLWTAQDPMRRPHYAFQKPGPGWGPDAKNSWVDVRNTENLYLMRVTSVYLFAEAAGNRDVTAKYKDELRRYVNTVYRIGVGEWDSENYHGHSITPLLSLYDFARDEEVRLLAKACLDWYFAAGAVKYYRGGFCGPTKRDYNHAQPFGGSAANMLWLAFGDCPLEKEGDWESDEVHLVTSNYRPPAAVLSLARKRFDRPVELFSSKPGYTASVQGDLKSPPEYLETDYFGHSYQMGSLASGTSEDGGDANGFKILVHSDRRGAEALQCVPGPDPAYVGSPQYQKGKVTGPNRVAQYGNLAIWLVRGGKSPWVWVVPESVAVSQSGGVTFLKCDRTWVAVRGLGVGAFRKDDALTRQMAEGEKAKFPGHQVLSAAGTAERFCGIAVEVGEPQTHGSFADFQRAVLAAAVDASKLGDGVVQYKAKDGKQLEIRWNDDARQLGVLRDGQAHDWTRHAQYLYLPQGAEPAGDASQGDVEPAAKVAFRSAKEPLLSRSERRLSGPIYAKWGEGALRVEAGGATFSCTVADDGRVTFRNGK